MKKQTKLRYGKGSEEHKNFLQRCWVGRTSLAGGVSQYTCWDPEFICPIGFVWCLLLSDTATILHSYVRPDYRRIGVRTLINEYIFYSVNKIQSSSGSKDGGEAFLKAYGYTFDKKRKDWFILRPKGNK